MATQWQHSAAVHSAAVRVNAAHAAPLGPQVLLETLRHVGVASQPMVPGLASEMLDQLGVDHAARTFECVAPGHRHALTAGAPLPTPRIVIPRYEPPEEPEPLEPPLPPAAAVAVAAVTAAGSTAAELSPEELAVAVGAQGKEVRRLKDEGLGNKDPQVGHARFAYMRACYACYACACVHARAGMCVRACACGHVHGVGLYRVPGRSAVRYLSGEPTSTFALIVCARLLVCQVAAAVAELLRLKALLPEPAA